MKLVVNTSGAIAGGAITHLRQLLPRLVECAQGDEVLVVGGEHARERLEPPAELPWVSVEGEPLGTMARIWWETRTLSRRLREIGPDVIFHPSNFALYGTRLPQVNLVHNLAPFLPEVISEESPWQRTRLRLLRWLTLDALERCTRTIFISEWGRALVSRESRNARAQGPVIGFGCDHAAGEPPVSVLRSHGLAPDGYVLSVSHLYRYKKLEHLIDAYAALGERVEHLPLVIVGSDFDRDYADRLAARARQMSARTVFTGPLPGEDVAALMRGCRLFVFTSLAENLPITLLEAMAAGAPIVTNRQCSMPEVCADAAAYVDPPTAEGYAMVIAGLISNGGLRKDLSERGRRRAGLFRWDDVARRTLDVLREAAGVAR